MGADIILIFAVAALVLALFGKTASRMSARASADTLDDNTSGGAGEVLWKINQAIELFRENIDPAKLSRGQDDHIAFYIGYIHAMAITFASIEQVTYDDVLSTPVTFEVLRLTPEGTSAAVYLASVLEQPTGHDGVEAGRMDALDASAAHNDGPYFLRMQEYFQAVETSDTDSGS